MLSLQNFTSLVQSMAAAAQGACSTLLDLTVGSVLRAIFEANAAIGLWLQWLILWVLAQTRLATSTGTAVDTWVADFGLTRLPAIAASGSVTFSRYDASQPALIVPGVQVKSADLTQTFTVIEDTTNPLWSATAGASPGYFVPAGMSSATVAVVDTVGGADGNVAAGTVTLLASAVSGIDTVSNAAPFVNGYDAESDAALRTRFISYINSRSLATGPAIECAVTSVAQNISCVVLENTPQPGFVTVVVDDGTGNPPASTIATCAAAANAVRPVGVTVYCVAPTVEVATISLVISTAQLAAKAALIGPVQQAVLAYVNALPIGGTLPYSMIAAIAYGVSPQITNVSSVVLNGGTADLVPGATGVITATTNTVSVS